MVDMSSQEFSRGPENGAALAHPQSHTLQLEVSGFPSLQLYIIHVHPKCVKAVFVKDLVYCCLQRREGGYQLGFLLYCCLAVPPASPIPTLHCCLHFQHSIIVTLHGKILTRWGDVDGCLQCILALRLLMVNIQHSSKQIFFVFSACRLL